MFLIYVFLLIGVLLRDFSHFMFSPLLMSWAPGTRLENLHRQFFSPTFTCMDSLKLKADTKVSVSKTCHGAGTTRYILHLSETHWSILL